MSTFSVPFTFLPHESKDGPPPPPPSPKTRIEPLPAKAAFEICWPNVVRIEHTYEPRLTLDLASVPSLELSAYETPTLAEMAPVVDGKPNVELITSIDLEELGRQQRWQRLIFQGARDVYEQMAPQWSGNREVLIGQVVRLVEDFVRRGPIEIKPALFNHDDLRRRILLTLNRNKVVQHIWGAIKADNTSGLTPVFNPEKPIRSTGDMIPWYTSKPCWPTARSHINFCVFDSTWEATEAFEIDRNSRVAAWAKNDHLGLEIFYVFNGVIQKYRPDFLIRLVTGTTLVLEVKGQDTQQNRTKRLVLDEWVRAINQHGGFGTWAWDVSYDPIDVADILHKHVGSS